MTEESGEYSIRVVGELGALGTDSRLVIPVDVRRAARWLGGKSPVKLIAELLDPGHVRFFQASSLEAQLDGARRRLVRENEPLERLAALTDRFRPVTYYSSDSRIHLGETIAVFLCTPSSRGQSFYIEARGNHIDVMTLEVRNSRLARFRADLELLDVGPESNDS